MKANNFNKSQIMKRAWNCYRKHSETMTFGQCLKWSWKKAWEELRKVNVGAWLWPRCARNATLGRRCARRTNAFTAMLFSERTITA